MDMIIGYMALGCVLRTVGSFLQLKLCRPEYFVVVVYHVTIVEKTWGVGEILAVGNRRRSTHSREFPSIEAMQTRLLCCCCLPCNHCSNRHGLLEKFWPLVIGCVLRTVGSFFHLKLYADPITSLELLN